MIVRKVMLLGDIGVGKSSIIQRLVFDRFETSYKPTIGVDVYRYKVASVPNIESMELIVWDTDGNFGDAIFRHVYLKEAAAAIIVGDLSRPETFDAVYRLAAGFKDARPGRPTIALLNKRDLIDNAQEPLIPPELKTSAEGLFMTSAKSGDNIQKAFHDAAAAVQRRGV